MIRSVSAYGRRCWQPRLGGIVLGATGRGNLRRHLTERQEAADAFAGRLRGLAAGFRARGLSQRAMVAELNLVGVDAGWGEPGG